MRPLRLAVLLLLPIALGATKPADPPSPPIVFDIKTADIPVVKTGKDLLKLEPIDSGDFSVRLGIESDKCDLNEGLLVYVAPVGKYKPARDAHHGEERMAVGPVIVEIKSLDVKKDKCKLVEQLEKVIDITRKEPSYFVAPVYPRNAGKHQIRVLSPAGDLLASRIVTVSNEEVAPWFRVSARDVDLENKKTVDAKIGAATAIPNWSPRTPYHLHEGDLHKATPGDDLGSFTLKAKNNVVSAVLQRSAGELDENLLARVWINGKPVLRLDTEAEQVEELLKARAIERYASPVKFSLRLDLKAFKTAPGDKVTVQLAYCPLGTKRFARNELIMEDEKARKLADDEDANPLIVVSNKIVITAR